MDGIRFRALLNASMICPTSPHFWGEPESQSPPEFGDLGGQAESKGFAGSFLDSAMPDSALCSAPHTYTPNKYREIVFLPFTRRTLHQPIHPSTHLLIHPPTRLPTHPLRPPPPHIHPRIHAVLAAKGGGEVSPAGKAYGLGGGGDAEVARFE